MNGSLRPVGFDLRARIEPLVLQRSADLPMLPAAATEALEVARRPDPRVDAVLAVLEREPPLAARVLAVASSAFYSRGTPPASLRNALVRLGTNATRDVIAMAVYSSSVFDAPGLRDRIALTFDHCVAVARAARVLAPQVGQDPEIAFLAGLLHDIGRARCLKIARKFGPGIDPVVLESTVDALHESAGAVLASTWSLPSEVVDACAGHHSPRRADVTALVAFADAIAHFGSARPPEVVAEQLERARAALGVPPERLEALQTLATEAMAHR